jgi:Protein of unknown function (DUF2589)
LRSLVLAQGISANTTIELLQQLGLTAPGRANADPTAATLQFVVDHPVPDPANPGETVMVPVRVSAPLLALVPLPTVSISDATIDIHVSLVGFSPPQPATGAGILRGKTTPSTSIPDLIAVYAPAPAAIGPQPAGLAISLRVTGVPPTEGLSQLMTLMQGAITTQQTSVR